MLHTNLMALSFIEPELWAIEVSHSGNKHFRCFRLPWPWPWPDDLHIPTWPVLPGDIPDVQIKAFWKLSSDRHTDTHKDRQNRQKL